MELSLSHHSSGQAHTLSTKMVPKSTSTAVTVLNMTRRPTHSHLIHHLLHQRLKNIQCLMSQTHLLRKKSLSQRMLRDKLRMVLKVHRNEKETSNEQIVTDVR